MPGGDPPIFVCSHIPMKRKLFTCIEVPVLGVLLRLMPSDGPFS
jgi:hypothetical protein